MSTAICFRSESDDYYQFLTDSKDIELLGDELGSSWYVECEYLYMIAWESNDFDDSVIKAIVDETVNKES